MHQDKKRAEPEEIKELELEKKFEQENILEIEVEEDPQVMASAENGILSDEVLEKKKRREVIFEMMLFLVLGMLLGVTLKTEAIKKVTIGFNDYQIVKPAESYDVAALKKNLDEQMAEQSASVQGDNLPTQDGQAVQQAQPQ
ncbi:MAG: hypothetical protein US25_C0005G0003 [Candidatus Moranbacteria bacterium GW2011_GWE1_36_7]|nr:MAG: hypothetical protein UR99_C0008G0019 [Candidatus Moranbacteria bacterium GW2011_GWD2_36_12]KKQ06829.1 MAG: hypothetical protein US16_C0008G0006 [Candidatus Moranbacteria bacterium GW2011_GWE2_36_40]KKQ15419.1 MAG: hypothetical protein US25_C0005G0003 [Candidatus Moranbacteria bacterium GW2011_GWE1_36_7]